MNEENSRFGVDTLKMLVDEFSKDYSFKTFIYSLGNHEAHLVNTIDFNDHEVATKLFGKYLEVIEKYLPKQA